MDTAVDKLILLYVGKLTNLILKDEPEIYNFFTDTTIDSLVHLQPKNHGVLVLAIVSIHVPCAVKS